MRRFSLLVRGISLGTCCGKFLTHGTRVIYTRAAIDLGPGFFFLAGDLYYYTRLQSYQQSSNSFGAGFNNRAPEQNQFLELNNRPEEYFNNARDLHNKAYKLAFGLGNISIDSKNNYIQTCNTAILLGIPLVWGKFPVFTRKTWGITAYHWRLLTNTTN